jgi:signal transduction histidine kinase
VAARGGHDDRRVPLLHRVAPWALLAATAVLTVFSAALDVLSSQGGEPEWVSYVAPLAVLMSSGVGIVLATRRPGNPIGWLLLVNGVVLAVSGLATNYSVYGLLEEPGSLPAADVAAVYDQSAWPLLFAPLTAIAFVFPDGRLPSPRWRPIAIAAIACFIASTAVQFFGPGELDEPFRAVSSPFPTLPKAVFFPILTLGSLGLAASLIAGAVAMRVRLRRAAGEERQQIKLVVYAAALIPLAVLVGWAESFITGNADTAATAALIVVLIAIPLAIGVAVMRYRLYEIDRIVNRTLVYVTLSILLAATYAAVSLLLGVALGEGSTLPTAAATLAVALTFGTLRSRVQRTVDRRFNRARYEGMRCVERHLADLRAGRATPEQTGAVLAEALNDPALELVYWLPESDEHVDATGRVVPIAPDDGRDLTPVRRGDLRLGAVLHDPALSTRPDVIESVINAAGLAIEIGRLRAEVRRRLAEVEESRARIVTAGYVERRRLERDLHDGAQQRLVSIGLAIRHVQAQLGPGAADIGATLEGTVDEIFRAIDELRELARGVRPACLDDGLAPALRELATRSPLRTEVCATNERFAEQIEAAAYFVASEALTNSVKHAQASRVTVSAERDDGRLILRVVDDGIGGAVASERSGLAGITDRVAALGGSVRVLSAPGEGTSVTAELPCGS